jgi:hypothetical protein
LNNYKTSDKAVTDQIGKYIVKYNEYNIVHRQYCILVTTVITNVNLSDLFSHLKKFAINNSDEHANNGEFFRLNEQMKQLNRIVGEMGNEMAKVLQAITKYCQQKGML